MNNLASNTCSICGTLINHDQTHCLECDIDRAIERVQNMLDSLEDNNE